MRFNSVRLRRTSTAVSLVLGGAVLAPAAWAGGVVSPVITSPSDGDSIIASPLSVTASSTAAATSVQFELGAGPIDTDLAPVTGGVATGSLEVYGVKGLVTITAADCTGGTCSPPGDSIQVDVDLDAPTIASPDPKAYVRNSVDVAASAPGGTVQYSLDGNPVEIPVAAPFDKQVNLNGELDGQHTIKIQQCNTAGDVCNGETDTVTVIKDTKAPRWTDLRSSERTVFPARDNYKDSTRLSARVNEALVKASVEIRKAGGPVVRTINLGGEGAGRVSVNWNGRKANGDVVSKGRYTYQFVGKDRAGFSGKSGAKSLVVSDKRLVKQRVSKTLSAWGSKKDQFAGSCSSVVRVGSNTVGLRSNSRRNGCTGRASAAVTLHKLHIGSAYKLGDVRVSALGGRTSSRPGRAVMYYVNKKGNSTALARLGSSQGWHNGRSVSLDELLIRGNLFWAIGTANGYWYDVSQFRVTYTATYLR